MSWVIHQCLPDDTEFRVCHDRVTRMHTGIPDTKFTAVVLECVYTAVY